MVGIDSLLVTLLTKGLVDAKDTYMLVEEVGLCITVYGADSSRMCSKRPVATL